MELFKLHDGTILVYRDPQYQYDTGYLLPALYTQNQCLSHLSFTNYNVYFFLVLLNSIDAAHIYIICDSGGRKVGSVP